VLWYEVIFTTRRPVKDLGEGSKSNQALASCKRGELHLEVANSVQKSHCAESASFPTRKLSIASTLDYLFTNLQGLLEGCVESKSNRFSLTAFIMKRSQEEAEIAHEEQSPSSSPAPSLSSNPAKYAQMDTAGENPAGHEFVMRCYLPPHPYGLSFPSYEAYEVHYQQHHVHRCTECHKNFPSDHYLNLHIAENHDPLNAAKRDKGEKTVGPELHSSTRSSTKISASVWMLCTNL
jgi:hypothetical protein